MSPMRFSAAIPVASPQGADARKYLIWLVRGSPWDWRVCFWNATQIPAWPVAMALVHCRWISWSLSSIRLKQLMNWLKDFTLW